MNNNGELNSKQKRFCEEYLVDLNATQAAIRAKYAKRSAYSMGYENLQKHQIQTYISKLTLWRSLRTQVTADRVLQELAKIAFAKEGVKTGDKLKALGMLAKHVCINDELLDLKEKAGKLARMRIGLENLERKLAEEGAKAGDNGKDQ
ncbi:MAG TPA: terminase small subunit [Sedimentisphaerales bacterium]|nr:terminase small subunit [Sedimentisphaerales bacterium]